VQLSNELASLIIVRIYIPVRLLYYTIFQHVRLTSVISKIMLLVQNCIIFIIIIMYVTPSPNYAAYRPQIFLPNISSNTYPKSQADSFRNESS
jgi:hypothetical protein